ncbi:MAG: hypothetical protein J1F36_05505 [Clostridiales bacterium]|nr:hypothetical protein [Clostridiales bacterium]
MNEIEQLFLLHQDRKLEWIPALQTLKRLEDEGTVVLFAGTYSFEQAIKNPLCDSAEFYFYTLPNKLGYVFYINPMDIGIKRDDEIFLRNHRRLYSKRYLSNCYFKEKDLRSGEYFDKKIKLFKK